MRLDKQLAKWFRKQDLEKCAGEFHMPRSDFNAQKYGRNRQVFTKLQSVVSSVLIGVNDVSPSTLVTLSDRNTGAG